jgi:hypothetical protein
MLGHNTGRPDFDPVGRAAATMSVWLLATTPSWPNRRSPGGTVDGPLDARVDSQLSSILQQRTGSLD